MNAELDMEYALQVHGWRGGYFCECGQELNSAETWARHLARVLDEMNALI